MRQSGLKRVIPDRAGVPKCKIVGMRWNRNGAPQILLHTCQHITDTRGSHGRLCCLGGAGWCVPMMGTRLFI